MSDQVHLGVANYRKDSYIVIAGQQKSECFFIVQQGKVGLSRGFSDSASKSEVLVAGDFFGVVSAMSSLSQIESAVALTDVSVITVRPNQHAPLIQKNSQVAVKILKQLSSRLRYLDEALTSLSLKNGKKIEQDDPSLLFVVGEYHIRQKHYKQAFYAYAKYLEHCPNGERREMAAKRLEDLSGRAGEMRTHAKSEVNRNYQKDEMLFAEGEFGDEFFVIQSGSVKISKIIDNKEVLLTTLTAGDIFGEMALLESKPRAASALASENCAVMAVNKANFELMIKTQPQLISKLTTLLSSRIWFTFKQLEVALMTSPLGKMYGALLIQLEKDKVDLNGNTAHVFSVRWSDLVKMLGYTEKDGFILMGELVKDKNIQVLEDKVRIASAKKLVRQADVYREIDARKKKKR